jgi:hypothetical protein
MKNEKEEPDLLTVSPIRLGGGYSKCIKKWRPGQNSHSAGVRASGNHLRSTDMAIPTAAGINDGSRLSVLFSLDTDGGHLSARADGTERRC